jgi:hypothetical protein
MKQKEIHELVKMVVGLLQKKVKSDGERLSDKKLIEQGLASYFTKVAEYTKGQLYEAQYILEKIEAIIYED